MVSGVSSGISASNYGTGATTINIAGTLEAPTGTGLVAYNDPLASDIIIIEAASGSIKGADGIYASNYGHGAIVLDIAGLVEGTSGDAVHAYQNFAGTSVTVVEAASASIKGLGGIVTSNYGSGATTIRIAGAVEATSTQGVNAYNNANASSLTILEAAGGSIRGVTGGVYATNDGHGAMVIGIDGRVEATSGYGINVYNSTNASDLTFTEGAGGTIKGSTTGLLAFNYGSGKTSLVIAGNVTGTSLDGVDVVNSANSQALTITQLAGTISGGQAGMAVANYSAYTATISVASGATVTGGTYGIWIANSAPGSVINAAGRISGGTASIFYDNVAGANTLNLFNTAVLSGAVNFNAITNSTINFHSGSYDVAVLGYSLANNTINLLSKTQTLLTPGLSGNSTTGRLVVVDAAVATQVAGLTRDFAGAALDVVGDVANAAGGRPVLPLGYAETVAKPNPTDLQTGAKAAQIYDAYGNLVWIRGFGGARTQEADSSRVGLDAHHYGLVGGYDHWYDDWRIGLFGGGGQAFGSLSDDAGSIRNDIGLAGIYARKNLGASWLETTVTGGYVGAETERRINGGAETATGSFNVGFAGVQVALATRYALGGDWSITPILRNRYLAIVSEGYTETGSSQNTRYGATTTQGLEQNLEARVAYRATTADGLLVNYWLKGAAFAQETIGDQRIDASTLGVGFSTVTGDSDVVYGGTVGLGLDVMLNDRASVSLAVDGTFATNQTRAGAMRAGWKLAF